MISKKMQDAFNKQINEELFSAYLYQAMAAHFEGINLRGIANWFSVQAQEEMVHAKKFYGHILERGGHVTLEAIAKPKNKWNSVLAAFEESLKHEKHITDCIEKLVKLADKEGDAASHTMLYWFIDEQVEEEASVEGIIEQLKMVGDNANGLFMINKILGERSAG